MAVHRLVQPAVTLVLNVFHVLQANTSKIRPVSLSAALATILSAITVHFAILIARHAPPLFLVLLVPLITIYISIHANLHALQLRLSSMSTEFALPAPMYTVSAVTLQIIVRAATSHKYSSKAPAWPIVPPITHLIRLVPNVIIHLVAVAKRIRV